MKKFSLVIVAALVVVAAWSGTASAQCGSGRFFGGRGNGCGIFHGGGFFRCGPSYTCSPTYYYYPSSGVIGQPDYTGGKKVMPSPSFQPYEGTPAPKKTTEEPPLPPRKIQPPNPKQDGPPTTSIRTIYINGYAYGQLSDGSYAKIADGTYARLSGYGSK